MAKVSKKPRRLSNGKYVCRDCGLSHAKVADAEFCCAEPHHSDQLVTSAIRQHQVGGDHYAKQAIQPWDIFDTWPLAERIGFFRGNALKYLMRLHDKDSPDMNARKAEHYCAKLAETLEADNG